MKHNSVTPYNSSDSKKDQVEAMFDNISNRYDFLNSLLSLGIHKGWRKKCVDILSSKKPRQILDVATGTADFAIECARLNPEKITGIDISEGMMKVGREKIAQKDLSHLIQLVDGNAETVTYPDNSFDAIVVGFGVRNFQNLEKGLSNLYRMLRPGGQLLILEFSYPTNFFIKAFYNFYFSYVTPLVGRIFSKDKKAYSYLMKSVKAFPHNQDFVEILNNVQFKNTSYNTLFFGVSAIYRGSK